mgnify:CR=1 FL=1
MRQGFVKVAATTPNIRVADVEHNTQEICRLIDETVGNGAKIVVAAATPTNPFLNFLKPLYFLNLLK